MKKQKIQNYKKAVIGFGVTLAIILTSVVAVGGLDEFNKMATELTGYVKRFNVRSSARRAPVKTRLNTRDITVEKYKLTEPVRQTARRAFSEKLTPDLSIKNIQAGYSYVFEGVYKYNVRGVEVVVCNNGKGGVFENVGLNVKGYKGEENIALDKLTLDEGGCTSEIIKYDLLFGPDFQGGYKAGESYSVEAEIDVDNTVYESIETNNTLVKSVKIPTYGNGVCEPGESHVGNPLDCEMECVSDYCNSKVQVYCACDDFNLSVAQHPCVGDKCDSDADTSTPPDPGLCPQDQCGGEEPLFDDYLAIQTKVYDCLADYFDYKPKRVNYLLFPDLTKPVCMNENGCIKEGGAAGADHILHTSLNGFVPYDHYRPIEASQLAPDVHETTHFFLYQMLHSAPRWFNEAVAIQTNERSGCLTQAMSPNAHEKVVIYGEKGDSYLLESTGADDQGVWFCMNSDGTDCHVIDENFYLNLKNGELTFGLEEIPGIKFFGHTRGTLWLLGLKLDYGCESDCVVDIVKKLRISEQNGCLQGTGCFINPTNPDTGFDEDEYYNPKIKEAADEVVGEDLSPLFDLLNITYDYSDLY